MTPTLNYIIQFLIGGSVIVGMSILAKYCSPKYAALLYGLPIQFTLATIFIYLGTDKGNIQELAKSSVFYTLLLVGFIATFYVLIRNFEFWPTMGISYGILIVASIVLLKII